MANKEYPIRQTLRWESILGGQAPTSHFGRKDQFRASIGIDPAQPIDDSDGIYSTIASGIIRPAASQKISGTTIGAAVLWQVPNPKDQYTYLYDALGSAYTIDAAANVSALSDAGSLSSALGNGSEYYDNYIYYRKNTDIARYGPLNGVPVFDPTYWTVTLSKTALVNTTYPTSNKTGIMYPNGIMKRHSDGRLYHFDVVGNQGTVHYIQTSKASVEGDTNNGSTYNALQFGYGLWPSAAESYGTYLAIGLFEGFNTTKKDMRAKFALWDTSSTSFNSITWHEFPDQFISAIKNANGVLCVVSGNLNGRGFRVSKYLGGYSFQELLYSETGEMPMPGAVDALLDQLLIGSYTSFPEPDGCVYSVGLQKAKLGRGIFNVMRATGGNSSTMVTALSVVNNVGSATELGFESPTISWTKGSGTSNNGIDQQGTIYNNAPSIIWGPLWRIGRHFTLDRIRVPLATAVAANMNALINVYVDNGIASVTAATINTSNYTKGERLIDEELGGYEGWNNVWVEAYHNGTTLMSIELPIEMDITIYDK